MNSYEKKIQDFLKTTNTVIDIIFVEHKPNKDLGETIPRPLYSVTITTPTGSMCIDYWYNIGAFNTPSEADILSALYKYPFSSFRDFCDEFGYDEDNEGDFLQYQVACAEYNGLTKIFTQEQLKELQKITS